MYMSGLLHRAITTHYNFASLLVHTGEFEEKNIIRASQNFLSRKYTCCALAFHCVLQLPVMSRATSGRVVSAECRLI
jgi:hypothetical protein